MTRHCLPLTLCPFLLVAAVALAQQAEKDYAAELPRLRPKEPAEALKSFRLRPGFRIELVAAEPLVQSPVAFDFDEDGRLFVVEYPEYNQYANPQFKGRGRVKRLEDADGDGRYEKATVYVDNLDSPTAVACWDGGVFVGAVPDILYCKDTDGDGRADVRRAVLTGFGRDAAGEAMLNSFRWGLDNRLHVSTSTSGGSVRRADQKDARAVSVRGQKLLLDPRTLDFETTSGGGQHGMSMDDYGRTFVCDNSNPIHLVMYDGRYLARNPYAQAPPAAVNIAPDGKYTKLFRISPVEPWRLLRTRLRTQGIVKGSDEGGQPAGFFTGATGVTVYRGDAWPAEYRGDILVGEVSGNLVYRARPRPAGVGLTAPRADRDVEFLASTDNWFRPVQFANGPDGALYVADMYRELIEGAAFLPPQILKHLDVASGLDRGRIYRIVPDGFKRPLPKLGRSTTAELVALLEHANGWHRDTAARLLYQRQDVAAVVPLRKLARDARSPLGRLHALYALDGLKALDAAIVLPRLDDPEPRVRAHALRLAERFEGTPAIRARLERMTDDPDPNVRYQLAFSLGSVSGEMPAPALAKLTLRDGHDPWARLAILGSVQGRRGDLFRLVSADRDFRAAAHGRAFLTALATQIGAANHPADVATVAKMLASLPRGEEALARELLRGLAARLPAGARGALTRGKAGLLFLELVREARTIAPAGNRKVPERVAAVRTLGLAEFNEARALFAELLQPRQPGPVQAAVLETLAGFDQPGVDKLILTAWPQLSPTLRATALETLLSRSQWINSFLDAVTQGKIGLGDVDPARVRLLEASPDKALSSRVKKLFAGARPANRPEVVAAYQKALRLTGDPARGKGVFKQHCSACHRLENVGESIGAELNAIREQGPEAILLNILDPNRDVKPQFVSYVLATKSGRLVTGMITAETATSLTLRRSDGTSEIVPRIDVEELKSTGLSFMPEGLEKQVDVPAMADLLAYLNAAK